MTILPTLSVIGLIEVETDFATREEDRALLCKARHEADFYVVCVLRPWTKGCATEVCVPLSKLAQCVDETV